MKHARALNAEEPKVSGVVGRLTTDTTLFSAAIEVGVANEVKAIWMISSFFKSIILDESVLTRALLRFTAGPGPIAMVILVRDEIDVIEQHLNFHLQFGIQNFVVTDNGSIDGTREVLAEFQKRLGKRFIIIDDAEPAYNQTERVNRMIRVAKSAFQPRWIIPSDADEFWYPVSGAYESELDGRKNVLNCFWHNFLPRADAPWEAFTDIGEMPGYHGRMSKTFCLARGLFGVYPGNHDARTIPRIQARSSGIRIYHYPIRTYAQFERKVVQGHRAVAKGTASQSVSWHWREYYKDWENGRLPQVYEELAVQKRTSQDETMAALLRPSCTQALG